MQLKDAHVTCAWGNDEGTKLDSADQVTFTSCCCCRGAAALPENQPRAAEAALTFLYISSISFW